MGQEERFFSYPGLDRRKWHRFALPDPLDLHLLTSEGAFACRMVEVSCSGATIVSAAPMPEEAHFRVSCDGFPIFGARVIWRRDDAMGVAFDQSQAAIDLATHCLKTGVPLNGGEATSLTLD
ncbi:MAG: PilZ domain-containing protein [Pseudomonadota bacterium]